MSSIIKFKNLEQIERKVKQKIEKIIKDRDLLEEIGKYAVDQVKGNVRNRGKDIFGTSYQGLKESTKKSRKYLAKKNSTHSTYSNGRSNLTLTGETMEAIKHKVSSSKPYISVQAEGNHKPYKGGSKKTISYSELLRIHHFGRGNNPARLIFGASKNMVKVIQNKIKRHLRRKLK